MAKPTLDITIKPNANNRRVQLLVGELDERIEAIMEWFTYLVAEAAFEDIKARAPTDIPGYPKLLQLRRVDLKGVDSAFAIMAPGYAHSQRLKGEDAASTLLFVKAKLILGPDRTKIPSPLGKLLAKHSPWTMGTLPFEPPPRHASVRAVRATEREVQRIEDMRKKDLPAVKAELAKQQIRIRENTERFARRVTRDLAFEVLRREFGIKATHRAHWRPAIRAAATTHADHALKELVRWFTVPSERRWKRNLVIKKEQPAVARRIKRFQSVVASSAR